MFKFLEAENIMSKIRNALNICGLYKDKFVCLYVYLFINLLFDSTSGFVSSYTGQSTQILII